MKKFGIITIFLFIFGHNLAALAQGFEIDMDAEAVDKFSGTLRADHLAVNDIAYFSTWNLCRRDGKLYLPSTAVPSEAPDVEPSYGFLFKAKVLPGKKLTMTLVAPTKPGNFDQSDVWNLVTNLFDPGGVFYNSWSCAEAGRISVRQTDFYSVVSIDGHTKLSSLVQDIESREFMFDD